MFVTRTAFEAMRARAISAEARAEDAHEMIRWLQAQLEKPAAPVETGATAPSPIERKADPIAKAIGQVAGSNRMLRTHLHNWAQQQQEAGVPADDIVDRLYGWDDADSEFDPLDGVMLS